jgi:D-alanyl-D-alanine carboxypeptidase/D-alanyl-D-alanine-endopeptidase (penicillin-binding protein 4)
MRGTAAAGRCTAKTGTLRFVSALAGYCPSADGHTLAFAVMGSGVNTFSAKKREDRIAVALARVSVG